MEGDTPVPWHRVFGTYWLDLAAGTTLEVEVEKDLSVQKQLLDVLVVRRRPGRLTVRLPDGFGDLRTHNLITFKSHREALDAWALKELTSHYVTYRKLVSPSRQALLPEEDFRLYAVCSRFPHNLANTLEFASLQPGVYDCRHGTDLIRVVVVRELPEAKHNAMLYAFGSPEQVRFAAENYEQRSEDTSTLLKQILTNYSREGATMSYTMQDFRRDVAREAFRAMTLEERKEFVKWMSAADKLEATKDLPVDEIEKVLKELRTRSSPGKQKRKK